MLIHRIVMSLLVLTHAYALSMAPASGTLDLAQKQTYINNLLDILIAKNDRTRTATLLRLIQGYKNGDAKSTKQLDDLINQIQTQASQTKAGAKSTQALAYGYRQLQQLETDNDWWSSRTWLPWWGSRITTQEKRLAQPEPKAPPLPTTPPPPPPAQNPFAAPLRAPAMPTTPPPLHELTPTATSPEPAVLSREEYKKKIEIEKAYPAEITMLEIKIDAATDIKHLATIDADAEALFNNKDTQAIIATDRLQGDIKHIQKLISQKREQLEKANKAKTQQREVKSKRAAQ